MTKEQTDTKNRENTTLLVVVMLLVALCAQRVGFYCFRTLLLPLISQELDDPMVAADLEKIYYRFIDLIYLGILTGGLGAMFLRIIPMVLTGFLIALSAIAYLVFEPNIFASQAIFFAAFGMGMMAPCFYGLLAARMQALPLSTQWIIALAVSLLVNLGTRVLPWLVINTPAEVSFLITGFFLFTGTLFLVSSHWFARKRTDTEIRARPLQTIVALVTIWVFWISFAIEGSFFQMFLQERRPNASRLLDTALPYLLFILNGILLGIVAMVHQSIKNERVLFKSAGLGLILLSTVIFALYFSPIIASPSEFDLAFGLSHELLLGLSEFLVVPAMMVIWVRCCKAKYLPLVFSISLFSSLPANRISGTLANLFVQESFSLLWWALPAGSFLLVFGVFAWIGRRDKGGKHTTAPPP